MKTILFTLILTSLIFSQISVHPVNNQQVVNAKVAETTTAYQYVDNFLVKVVDEDANATLIDTTSTKNWYLSQESSYVYDIVNPDRGDDVAYTDTLMVEFQLPVEFSSQDTISFYLYGWTQLLIGSTSRNSFDVNVYEVEQNNSLGSNISVTDSVVFAEGASVGDATANQVKIVASSLSPQDRVRVVIISRLQGSASQLWQEITSMYLSYLRRVY